MREILLQRMISGLVTAPPLLVRRDAPLPRIGGKAIAVVGVRRGGKTSFLWQCLADRLVAGSPREALLMLGLEDDRLVGVTAADLSWLMEEYFRLYPAFRDRRSVTWFLDEVPLVDGWEMFARRLIDTERIDLFLSGSSAKLDNVPASGGNLN